MLILNPIYDVAFKYLLEDLEIAKGLLSKIIGEEITDLSVRPQETTTTSERFLITILRLDFKAVIRTQSGGQKKILIELQKGKFPNDIMRFRKYLGENYRKPDILEESAPPYETALPITTIYFLGFPLPTVPTPVLKVNREYIDLITDQKIEAKDPFIEQLTHDSFIIQISRLGKKDRTELEHILTVFNQIHITEDPKILQISSEEVGDHELLLKMTDRLRRGATEEDILRNIEAGEQVDRMIESKIRETMRLEEMNNELKGANDGLMDENKALKRELAVLREKLSQEGKA